METVESPLDVLSRAATMLQHCHSYNDIDDAASEDKCSESSSPGSTPNVRAPAAKQLPTAKWKRDRRSSTKLPDYKPRESNGSNGSSKVASRSHSFKEQPTFLVENSVIDTRINLARTESAGKGDLTASGVRLLAEIPIDMSVSGKLRPRGSPPPYCLVMAGSAGGAGGAGLRARPSVIARAAPKALPPIAPAPAPATAPAPVSSPAPTNSSAAGSPASLSMCDPVIDEHFRRSLGADYMALFANKNNNNYQPTAETPISVDRGSSPILFASDPCTKFLSLTQESKAEKPKSKAISPPPVADKKIIAVQMEIDDGAGLSVDDHFAKALGDTWKKLQEKQQKTDVPKAQTPPSESISNDTSDVTSSKILSRQGLVI